MVYMMLNLWHFCQERANVEVFHFISYLIQRALARIGILCTVCGTPRWRMDMKDAQITIFGCAYV